MAKDLINTVVSATGLPEDPVRKELNTLLGSHGKDADDITLDELRVIMAEYLQTVMLELADIDESIPA